MICVDNLNSIKPDTAANQDEWALNNESNERRTTLERFQNDEFMPHLLDRLMDLLSQFKSAVYVRTARRDRWNLPSEVDRITDIIERAGKAAWRYGDFASTHEAYGVLAEEVAELLDAIRSNDAESIRDEAVDVAAVAYRLASVIDRGVAGFGERSGFDGRSR